MPCFNQHGIVWESVVMYVNERVVLQVSERVMMNVSENVVMHVSARGVMHVRCHWHILRIFISEGARPVIFFLLNVSSKILC